LLLIGIALLVTPILAIVALVRSGRLQRELPSNLVARLQALEKQVGELNRKLSAQLSAGRGEAVAPAPAAPGPPETPQEEKAEPPKPVIKPPAPPAPALTPSVKVSPAQPADSSSGLDLEALIAGRWLNRIGVIAVIFGAAFFLKLEADSDWLGPTGRTALWLLIGAVVLVWSEWLHRRQWLFFANSITGLGGGLLYLTVNGAWKFYDPPVLPQTAAFIGLVLVTAVLVMVAVRRDSQTVAVMGLLGGLLTPILMSTGADRQVELFTYLLILNGGVMAVAHWRGWRSLDLLALGGTLIYFTGWYDRFYSPARLVSTLSFATLFFAEFSALPVLQARNDRDGRLHGSQVALVLINASWFLAALHAMLYRNHRWELTFAVVVLAGAHLAVMNLLPPRDPEESPSATRLLFAGLALTFITLAIPIRLEGKWITIAWAVEGAMLVWSGYRAHVRQLRWAALALFGIVGIRILLLLDTPEPPMAFFNARFAIFLVTVVTFLVSAYIFHRNREEAGEGEKVLFRLLAIAANFFLLLGLSLEVWSALAGAADVHLARHLGLSILWLGYAALLILVGVRIDAPALRWQGLVLIGVVIAKVFFVDLAFLARTYRVVSFLILGGLLIGLSFLYQKRLASKREQEGA
jgi:uncharacterized membrane protein